jgi:hypothetical protein
MPKGNTNPINGQPLGPKPAYVNENVPYLPNDAPNPWYKGGGSTGQVNNASPLPGQRPTQPYGEQTTQNPQWLQPSQAGQQQSPLLNSLTPQTGPSTAGGVPTIDIYRGNAPKPMTPEEMLRASSSGGGNTQPGWENFSVEAPVNAYGPATNNGPLLTEGRGDDYLDDHGGGIMMPTFEYDPGTSSGYDPNFYAGYDPSKYQDPSGGIMTPTFENPGSYDPTSGYPSGNPSVGGGVMMPSFENPLTNPPGGGVSTPTFQNPLLPGGGNPPAGDTPPTSNLPPLGTNPTTPGTTPGTAPSFDGNLPNLNTSITPQIVYEPDLTAKAGNQILATQAQQSDPRWLMKQFSTPGRSWDAGTAAAATPYLAQGQFLGNQGYANLALGDMMANQESLMAGEIAREKEGLGLGNLLARLQEQQLSFSSPLLNTLLQQ